jgi:TonB family protein
MSLLIEPLDQEVYDKMVMTPINPKHQFRLINLSNTGVYANEKRRYRVLFEKALLTTLICVILFFIVSRRVHEKNRRISFVPGFTTMTIDMVQATKHGGMPRPPDLPQVPIPVEDEYLPDDETIDIFQFDPTEGISLFDGVGSMPDGGGMGGMGLKPIREVIPEYPKDLRKKGIEGIILLSILVNSNGAVDSVEVLQNTSMSRRLERSAIQAAYGSRYVPAKRDGKKIACWIRRRYEFGGR